jgi:hypothetical protein
LIITSAPTDFARAAASGEATVVATRAPASNDELMDPVLLLHAEHGIEPVTDSPDS